MLYIIISWNRLLEKTENTTFTDVRLTKFPTGKENQEKINKLSNFRIVRAVTP